MKRSASIRRLCALLLAILVTREAKRFASHRRYIEYRTLAEALRVQLFLHYAGSRTEAQHLMTWTQQRETPWILCAVCAVNAEKPPEKIRDIRGCWVENQRTYHEKAGRRTAAQCGRNDRLLRLTAVCAVLLYCGGVLFELLCGGLILTPAVQVQNPGFWRTLLKILLGTVLLALPAASRSGKGIGLFDSLCHGYSDKMLEQPDFICIRGIPGSYAETFCFA